MTDKECLRVEIADCPWTEELKFQVRIGDLRGSISQSNLKTVEEVLDAIRMSMELNWEELENTQVKINDLIDSPNLSLNANQNRRLRKVAKVYLYDDVGMALSLVVNLGLKQLEGGRK